MGAVRDFISRALPLKMPSFLVRGMEKIHTTGSHAVFCAVPRGWLTRGDPALGDDDESVSALFPLIQDVDHAGVQLRKCVEVVVDLLELLQRLAHGQRRHLEHLDADHLGSLHVAHLRLFSLIMQSLRLMMPAAMSLASSIQCLQYKTLFCCKLLCRYFFYSLSRTMTILHVQTLNMVILLE
jgi:hypothetical protein